MINIELITDTEAEQRVISAMLHSENACIETVATLDDGDFFRPMNKDVYSLIKSLYQRGVKPTYVELIKEGHSLGLIQNAADMREITTINEQYIDEENVSWWIDRVRKASKGRKAQQLIKKCYTEIQEPTVDIAQFIQSAGSDFMALAMDADNEKIETAQEVAAYGEQLVAENCEKWRKAQDDQKLAGIAMEGVSTGLPKLDSLTLGYKSGDLIILGAQTGHGKTAFALNTAMAACVEGNKPVLYINTEMSRKQIVYRWGAILSQIPLQKIRTGSLTNGELYQVQVAFKMLHDSGFFTSYMPNLTPEKSQTLARKAKLQYEIELVILDYVGRMDTSDPKNQEWQVLYNIVKSQKLLAQNLEIACMVLVQLNPDGTLQGAKRMKNECDLMLKLFPLCEDLQNEESRAEAQRKFEKKYGKAYEDFNYYIWVDKSRDSEAGLSIPLCFGKDTQQIREARLIEKTKSEWQERGK